ncbi:MAG: heme biosynthesis HemY N-terminal domain-containing protein [Methylococcales bacterium]
MKKLFYFLAPLLITVALAFFVNDWLHQFNNPGYVLIGIGHWSLETSLVTFSAIQLITFYVLYLFFRWMGWLFRLPGQIKNRGKNINFNRSQQALIAGLVDSAEGNWERAENVLIKHASHSGAPLIHYLTAAKAAQSRGAFDKRDDYLRKATQEAPDSTIMIGLTHAELSLSGNQFEEALETLTKLHAIDPTHAKVLKLLHQTYQHVGDWQGLRKLLPLLHTHKVIMEAEVKQLEIKLFSQLLKQSVEKNNIAELKLLWLETPDNIKNISSIAAIYFAAVINAGLGGEIENELAEQLSVDWDLNLVVLFGSIESNNVLNQLERAEKWSYIHQEDAVLLTVLGKLATKCGDTSKAESYLAKSIAAEPTVQAYKLLGDLLLKQGDNDNAINCYKNGMQLASSGAIDQINATI